MEQGVLFFPSCPKPPPDRAQNNGSRFGDPQQHGNRMLTVNNYETSFCSYKPSALGSTTSSLPIYFAHLLNDPLSRSRAFPFVLNPFSIMAFTNTAAHLPPPTTNNLDAAQRARVMRTSRKLGAVLGTTPILLESCGGTVLVPTALHPVIKRDTHTHTSSHTKRHRGHREGTSSSISEISPLMALSRTSVSSEESLLYMPNSSTEELPTPKVMLPATRTRSQRDAPPPLVLRLNSAPLSPTDPRVQSPSVPLSPLSNTDVPATPIELSRAEARRRKMARVVRLLGENVPPELVFRPSDMECPEIPPGPSPNPHDARSGSHPTRTSAKLMRPRSRSVGPGPQWQRLLELPAPVFSSGARAPADQQWVGVWNRRNIAQVQRELRTLRPS
jgi:hypothetical protein